MAVTDLLFDEVIIDLIMSSTFLLTLSFGRRGANISIMVVG
jgi:hypothetical protein